MPGVFLLTRPLRDVTIFDINDNELLEFLLTRPLRDVTKIRLWREYGRQISTHTPLAGRDFPALRRDCLHWEISTHTPLAGRDEQKIKDIKKESHFYSHAPCGT